MDYLLLWFILKLDAIFYTTAGLSSGIAIVLIMLAVVYTVNYEDLEKNVCNSIKSWTRSLVILFCITLFVATVIPNTKQAAIIYCLPKIINNEHTHNISDKILKLSNLWLDEKIKEATKPTNANYN